MPHPHCWRDMFHHVSRPTVSIQEPAVLQRPYEQGLSRGDVITPEYMASLGISC